MRVDLRESEGGARVGDYGPPVVPVDLPAAGRCRCGEGFAIHDAVSLGLRLVGLDPRGGFGWDGRANAKSHGTHAPGKRGGDGIERDACVVVRRGTHTFDQRDGLVERELLALGMMGQSGEAFLDEFDAAAIQEFAFG